MADKTKTKNGKKTTTQKSPDQVVGDLIDAADEVGMDAEELTATEGISPQDLFKDDSPKEQNQDARLRDVIDGVMSTEDISIRSVLDDKHIVGLARGRIFAKRYKSAVMRALCQYLQEGRISKDGRGRKDLVATMKAAVSTPEENPEATASRRFGRFLG